jgi:class 3 adenylate cyclase
MQQWQTILQTLGCEAWLRDASGRVLMVNAWAAEVIGQSVEEVVGRDYSELSFPPEFVARLLEADARVLASRVPGEAPLPPAMEGGPARVTRLVPVQLDETTWGVLDLRGSASVEATQIQELRKTVLEQAEQLDRETFLRRAFQQYVPSEVVNHMTEARSLSLSGRHGIVTVLLADLRGFTRFTEGRDPQDVVEILNLYFATITPPLVERGGMIDKYIGDAVLAHFGLWNHERETPLLAVQAAVEMRQQLNEFNSWLKDMGMPALKMGIAIHTGEALVGNIGCKARMDFTVIGDVVNTTARLEEIVKEVPNRILISGPVYEVVKDHVYVQPLDAVQVRGRSASLDIYLVLGLKSRSKPLPNLEDAFIES